MSSKASSAVSEDSMPTFSSLRLRMKPGVLQSTKKRVTPSKPRPLSVRATRVMKSTRMPLVMKILLPLMIQSSPSGLGPRLHVLDVRPRVGLGDAQAGYLLALDCRHQVVLLLLFGPELQDRRGRHVSLHRHRHSQPPAAAASHLLREHHGGEVVAALAAVFHRIVQPEVAQLAHPGEDPVGEVGVSLPFLGVGCQFCFNKIADRLPQFLVFGGEIGHRYSLVTLLTPEDRKSV